MNAEQALLELYRASRLAALPAQQHEQLRQCAEIIMRALNEEQGAAASPSPIEEVTPEEV